MIMTKVTSFNNVNCPNFVRRPFFGRIMITCNADTHFMTQNYIRHSKYDNVFFVNLTYLTD